MIVSKAIAVGLISTGVVGSGLASWGYSRSLKRTRRSPSSNTQQHPTIGQVSAKYTTDSQWKFLFKLGEKVFEYLSKDTETKKILDLTKHKSILDWLKNKLKTTINTKKSHDWEKFKDLCTKAIDKENSTELDEVTSPEARFCFMGSWDPSQESGLNSHIKLMLSYGEEKGSLGAFSLVDEEDKSNDYQDVECFQDWQKSNHNLWTEFISDKGKDVADKADHKDWETKFEEWYDDEKTRVDFGIDDGYNSEKKISEILKPK